MNNNEVAHLWANEMRESARGSNFYFEGNSLYSYGDHFKVGRIVRNKKGQKAYLVNLNKYSTTTQTHQRCMLQAIPSGEYSFDVGRNCIDNDHGVWFIVKKLHLIIDYLQKYKKCFVVNNDFIENVNKEMIDYIYFFELGKPENILKGSPDNILGMRHELSCKSKEVKKEYVDKLKKLWDILIGPYSTREVVDAMLGEGVYDKYLKRNEKHKEKFRQKEELWKLNTEELIRKWKKGEIKNIYTTYTYLRIYKDKVETSKGISLSIEEASRIYKNIKEHILCDVKDHNGFKWLINHITVDLLIAGCHKIKMEEIEETAKELGLA